MTPLTLGNGRKTAVQCIMKTVLSLLFISGFFILFLPAPSLGHDGDLDRYGCHQDKEHGNYHCHEGMLKGGSFNSQQDMIRQLRQQLENLGRPWPYGDLIEEDITSPKPRTEE